MSRLSRFWLAMVATGAVTAGLVAFNTGTVASPVSMDPHAALTEALAVYSHPELHQEAAYEGGRAACRRCHLREYRSWEETPHATALETLPEENRTDENCVKCHVTGWGEPTGFTSIEETPELAGVGCEECHGPGSLYKPREIMEDREASTANGLLIPDEQTCLGCHNDESPEFEGFDYQDYLARGVHEIQR